MKLRILLMLLLVAAMFVTAGDLEPCTIEAPCARPCIEEVQADGTILMNDIVACYGDE